MSELRSHEAPASGYSSLRLRQHIARSVQYDNAAWFSTKQVFVVTDFHT